MFLLNSRLGLFTAAKFPWHPFSRSYGVILPSSLTSVLPIVLGFSPRLPVSVCGTGAFHSPAVFLASVKSSASLLVFAPHQAPELPGVLHYLTPSTLAPALPSTGSDYPSVSLLRLFMYGGIGFFTDRPSPTTLRPRLRSRLTLGGRTFPRKP